jgi:DNA-binding response OmpR family regulator
MHIPRFVLVVEDDSEHAEMLLAGLEAEGLRAECATDGSTGLGRIWAELPDVVLLDIAVPKVNGALIGMAMRADPKTAAIPIVMQSGRPEVEIKRAFAGYDAYFSKPFDLWKLVATVKRLAG